MVELFGNYGARMLKQGNNAKYFKIKWDKLLDKNDYDTCMRRILWLEERINNFLNSLNEGYPDMVPQTLTDFLATIFKLNGNEKVLANLLEVSAVPPMDLVRDFTGFMKELKKTAEDVFQVISTFDTFLVNFCGQE